MSDKSKVPASYRLQRTCVSCKHCGVIPTFAASGYYCLVSKDEPPKCNKKWRIGTKEWEQYMNQHEEWESKHEILPYYICDEYRPSARMKLEEKK